MAEKIIICDLDGCLINTAWIWQAVKMFKFDKETGFDFFNKAANCEASKIDVYCLKFLFFKLSGGLKLHFLTARSQVIEVETINFIQQKTGLVFGKDFTISFRAETDTLPAYQSKQERLAAMLKEGKEIVLAIDDEDACVQMYRCYNIPAIKWLNGMLPVEVVESYGNLLNGTFEKEKGGVSCQN